MAPPYDDPGAPDVTAGTDTSPGKLIGVSSPSAAPSVDAQELTVRLRQGALRLARRLRQESDNDFGQSLVSALATIDRHGPITLGELAEREHLAPPSITKLVTRLEADGLVRREVSPADGRVVQVTVTTAGATRLARGRERATAWLTQRLETLDPEHSEHLPEVVALLEALLAEEQR